MKAQLYLLEEMVMNLTRLVVQGPENYLTPDERRVLKEHIVEIAGELNNLRAGEYPDGET